MVNVKRTNMMIPPGEEGPAIAEASAAKEILDLIDKSDSVTWKSIHETKRTGQRVPPPTSAHSTSGSVTHSPYVPPLKPRYSGHQFAASASPLDVVNNPLLGGPLGGGAPARSSQSSVVSGSAIGLGLGCAFSSSEDEDKNILRGRCGERQTKHLEISEFGTGDFRSPSLEVIFGKDGSRLLGLVYVKHRIMPGIVR